MFEIRKVKGSTITFNDVRYSAPELQWAHGKSVRVLRTVLYPHSLAVFDAEEPGFICMAEAVDTDNSVLQQAGSQVLEAIQTRLLRQQLERGPVSMRKKKMDRWIADIKGELEQAQRDISYGNKHHAMESLLKVATACVECLNVSIDAESDKILAQFRQVFEQLETADPAATGSAA